MSGTITAACCIIGDEILSGKTQDTNSHYLAKILFSLGIELKCVQIIGDNREDITKSVRKLSSTYDIVFTSGGIGPTHDDITYEAIAAAYDLELKLDGETYEYFEKQLEKGKLKMTKNHARMATFPYPARLLKEKRDIPIPIVVVNENIYILPGVPVLFKVLLNSLQTRLALMSGSKFYRNEIATKQTEVMIADILTEIQSQAMNEVKIGSYPLWKDKDGIQVIISVSGKDQLKVDKVSQEIMTKTNGWLYSSLL
ncbi:hypothetical protein G6F46_005518 [Rhizopus delemar]|uniref:MoaB/Mog domain-containing protein n=2 Tax=Rhizopus TaxID=4842 RepID=A0A9P7CNT5_9FUNG|nr:hypothetical protein G6F55_004842 [Rhizopus delemar]KAG1545112.1 hypothetical protein G6F51_005661 [Rhizopus arrhizus]KAG1497732.1 hypothetical protein G6F54_005569 [Rhizopus delemar]KAG1512436.1 hypothetical protein G6F53_005191 [Rhizopus delemar]KAG1526729.1 hypothetical protein G6F52_002168 [Rhizopus delemar]